MIVQTTDELKGLTAPPVSVGCERARGWFRDPAVWAWVVVGLLALLPLRSALAQFLT